MSAKVEAKHLLLISGLLSASILWLLVSLGAPEMPPNTDAPLPDGGRARPEVAGAALVTVRSPDIDKVAVRESADPDTCVVSVFCHDLDTGAPMPGIKVALGLRDDAV